jgi:predicted transcriptional regulator of viral defense system
MLKMGKEIYLKDIENLFKKSPVVDYYSINQIINNKKTVKGYAKQIIRNLILKGKLKRLTNGYYTMHNDPSLLVFCFKQSYLGLQDALSFHNLWEQETIPVIITTRKIRQGIRKVLGTNVLIRRLDKKYFFGFDYYRNGFYFPYSDIEKSFIDMVYFKERLDRETIKNIKKAINLKKLDSYLKNYPKKIKNKLLNHLK